MERTFAGSAPLPAAAAFVIAHTGVGPRIAECIYRTAGLWRKTLSDYSNFNIIGLGSTLGAESNGRSDFSYRMIESLLFVRQV